MPLPGAVPADQLLTSVSADYDRSGLPVTLTYPDGTVVDMSQKDGLGRTESWGVQVPGGALETRWAASYGGMRQIAGGSPGGISTTRTYHPMGLESGRSVFSSGGQEGRSYRFRLGRELADTGRATALSIQSNILTQQNLARDSAQRFSYWGRTERALVPKSYINEDLPDAPPVSAWLDNLTGGGQVGPHDVTTIKGWQSGYPLGSYFELGSDHQIENVELTQPDFDGGVTPTVLWTLDYDDLGNRELEDWSAGTLQFSYTHDWSSRLVRIGNSIDGSADELFVDPFGRRVMSKINGVTTLRVPWGDQIIAEYAITDAAKATKASRSLRRRNYWYGGVDRLAGYDFDRDLDGVAESRYTALTDQQGTVLAIIDDDGEFDDEGKMILEPGRVAESYLYRPDGSFQIVGPDLKPPRLKRGEVYWPNQDTQTIVLLFSETVDDGLEGVMELRDAGGMIVQSGPWKLWLGGRGRSLELVTPLTTGETYHVFVDGMEDLSGNRLDREYAFQFTAGESGEAIVFWQEDGQKSSGYPGEVLQVLDGPTEVAVLVDTRLEEGDVSDDTIIVRRYGVAIEGSVRIHDPQPPGESPSKTGERGTPDLPPYPFVVLWEPDDPADYVAYADNPLVYDITINFGGSAKSVFEVSAGHSGEGNELWSDWYDSPLLTSTQVGNDRFQHGRPFIKFVPNRVELYDHRARWYEPKTYRFLEPDPLGPVDTPTCTRRLGLTG